MLQVLDEDRSACGDIVPGRGIVLSSEDFR